MYVFLQNENLRTRLLTHLDHVRSLEGQSGPKICLRIPLGDEFIFSFKLPVCSTIDKIIDKNYRKSSIKPPLSFSLSKLNSPLPSAHPDPSLLSPLPHFLDRNSIYLFSSCKRKCPLAMITFSHPLLPKRLEKKHPLPRA